MLDMNNGFKEMWESAFAATKDEQNQAAARDIYKLYSDYVGAGFTEDEALKLIGITIGTAIAQIRRS